MYIRELSVQYRRRPLHGDTYVAHRLTSPTQCAALFTQLIGAEAVEVCGVLCLSTRWDILAYHELSRGTLDATLVNPRDVFRVGLLANARSIVIGHNHPSGDVTPSPEDNALTRRIKQASEVVGVDLMDHVIVSEEGRYFSFQEAGQLVR